MLKQNEMEKIIREYFQSWINKDHSKIEKYFSDSIVYIEYYGPEYTSKKQCLKWFNDWNKKGSVLEWKIKNFKQLGKTCFVEWYFKCEFDKNIDEFDGISIIEFENNKISLIKEFQSKSEHHYPYNE